MLKKYTKNMFCFSPPVMLATFFIEIALAIYAIWRYKMTALTRLISLLLGLLAVFQLAEYLVCGGLGLSGLDWSRVGFMAITLLPPIGLHIVHEMAGKQNKPLIIASYATSAAFVAYFAFATSALTGNQCTGNYVIFELPLTATWIYSVYYYGWVITGLVTAWQFAKSARKTKQQSALKAFAVGYASLLIPTATVNLIAPETLNGIPSIMCGFAVILALIVGFKVLPNLAEQKVASSRLANQ